MSVKKSIKAYSTLFCALAGALTFTACGDDSGANASSSLGSNGGNVSSETYRISVNKKDQTATIYFSESSEDMCVLEGDKLAWKSVQMEPEIEHVMYRFVGDTLVYSVMDEESGKYNRRAKMFVGGHSGDINGSWTIIPCEFYMDTETTFCDSEADEEYYQKYADKMVITSNSVTYSYIDDEYTRNRKYETSSYRAYFYRVMAGEGVSHCPIALNLFDYAGEVDFKELYPDVSSSELSANGETLSAGDYTVSVNVKKFFVDKDAAATVEVKGNGKTCTSEFKTFQKVTKDLCKVENMEYLRFDDEEEDVNGNEIVYAYTYEYKNDEEFAQCMQTMFQ